MKTLGIIGGLGPESTVDYYQSLMAAYREQTSDDSYPAIIINSINLTRAIALVTANELAALAEWLASEIEKLRAAGADFALISANTPHIAFDEIARRSPLPLISIVEATCEAAKKTGLKRLALLGTRFTMQGHFYQDVFSRAGIALAAPKPELHSAIHEKYMGELVKGVFRPETRAWMLIWFFKTLPSPMGNLLDIVADLKRREQIQGAILAGTELPLLLPDASYDGVPMLNTTQIHVRAAVGRLLS